MEKPFTLKKQKTKAERARDFRESQRRSVLSPSLKESKTTLLEKHLESLLKPIQPGLGILKSKEDLAKCSNCDRPGFQQPPGFDPTRVKVPENLNVLFYSDKLKRNACMECNAPGWKLALLGQKPLQLQKLSEMGTRARKALWAAQGAKNE